MDRNTALDQLRQYRREEIERRIVQLVAAALNAGATWQAIADALGTTQPYAHRKYRPLIEERREVRVRRPDSEETPDG